MDRGIDTDTNASTFGVQEKHSPLFRVSGALRIRRLLSKTWLLSATLSAALSGCSDDVMPVDSGAEASMDASITSRDAGVETTDASVDAGANSPDTGFVDSGTDLPDAGNPAEFAPAPWETVEPGVERADIVPFARTVGSDPDATFGEMDNAVDSEGHLHLCIPWRNDHLRDLRDQNHLLYVAEGETQWTVELIRSTSRRNELACAIGVSDERIAIGSTTDSPGSIEVWQRSRTGGGDILETLEAPTFDHDEVVNFSLTGLAVSDDEIVLSTSAQLEISAFRYGYQTNVATRERDWVTWQATRSICATDPRFTSRDGILGELLCTWEGDISRVSIIPGFINEEPWVPGSLFEGATSTTAFASSFVRNADTNLVRYQWTCDGAACNSLYLVAPEGNDSTLVEVASGISIAEAQGIACGDTTHVLVRDTDFAVRFYSIDADGTVSGPNTAPVSIRSLGPNGFGLDCESGTVTIANNDRGLLEAFRFALPGR